MRTMKKQPKIDKNNTDLSYWEEILRKEGLSMERGLTAPNWLNSFRGGKDVISYIGTSNNVVGMEEEQYRHSKGKNTDLGCGPDDEQPDDESNPYYRSEVIGHDVKYPSERIK
jgi:hypothetical protein